MLTENDLGIKVSISSTFICTNFSYECRFGSFFQLRFGFGEKFVRKTCASNVDEIDGRSTLKIALCRNFTLAKSYWDTCLMSTKKIQHIDIANFSVDLELNLQCQPKSVLKKGLSTLKYSTLTRFPFSSSYFEF